MPPNDSVMPFNEMMTDPAFDHFYDRVSRLPSDRRGHICNVTHRLAEVEWIARTLDRQLWEGRAQLHTRAFCRSRSISF